MAAASVIIDFANTCKPFTAYCFLDFVPDAEIWEDWNLLGVFTQYEILGFCRLGLNQRIFSWTKTWDIPPENQISANYRYIENITKTGDLWYHNWYFGYHKTKNPTSHSEKWGLKIKPYCPPQRVVGFIKDSIKQFIISL